jgi:hypothetical protein
MPLPRRRAAFIPTLDVAAAVTRRCHTEPRHLKMLREEQALDRD